MATAAAVKAADPARDLPELEEFRSQALGPLLWSPFVLATGLLIFVYDERRAEISWVPALVAMAVGVAAVLAPRRGATLAGLVLVVGLGLVLAAVQWQEPSAPFAVLYALTVVVASAVLGPTAGFGTAAGATGLLLWLGGPGGVSPLVRDTALFAVWAAAGVSWLATSPVRTALGWAWSSYAQALARTEELRDRQGELGRLSKSLAEACARLEQMNQELEQARQAAEEARRLKSEFAATVSHELRTPLNLIIGFSEMMVVSPRPTYADRLPESYRGDVETIYRNTCHVSSLIDDILDLSQIDAHRMALQKEFISLARVVDESVASVSMLYAEEGLSLTVDLPPGLPLLYADPVRIRQVLINLLTNAVRYTDHGGVSVTARLDGREVVVAVRDTGIGIAPEELPRVFEEFRQAGSVRRRGRSGLGLAVSKRFIEMHGGNVWVESRPGEGSTFCFSLPVCESVVSAVPSRSWSMLTEGLLPEPKRTVVVIAEDGEVARVYHRYLDAYRVVGVANANGARRLADDGGVEAIVVGSPRLAEAWQKLLQMQPAPRALPLVNCSLRTGRDVAQEMGVASYLAKPVTREQLRAALSQLDRPIHSLLVVDDDDDMVRLLARMAHSTFRGCQVRQAYDGSECLRLLREARPDAVLLDLVMPGVDGYAVLEEMRRDDGLCDVPVIVVSAKSPGEDIVVAGRLEVSREGGLSVAELMDCVRGCLDALLKHPVPQSNGRARQAGPGE